MTTRIREKSHPKNHKSGNNANTLPFIVPQILIQTLHKPQRSPTSRSPTNHQSPNCPAQNQTFTPLHLPNTKDTVPPMWRAVIIMFAGMSLIPAGDAAAKLLTNSHGVEPIYAAWSRFALGAVMALVLIERRSLHILGNWRIWLRSSLIAAGISFIILAARTAPLADVFGAFFVAPLFSYALSGIFLKEPLTLARSLLILCGFGGVLLVVRPGLSMAPGLEYAFLAGLFYGAFLTTSRWVAPLAPSGTLLGTQLLLSSLMTTPFVIGHFPEITAPVAALTAASALFSMLANLLLLMAYRLAPASQLAPLVYFQLLAATALGWLIFKDTPSALTALGLGVIITSGLASAALNMPARRRAP